MYENVESFHWNRHFRSPKLIHKGVFFTMAIETIAVLGAGQMGSGIAQIAAANGYKVIMRDIKQEFCDKGRCHHQERRSWRSSVAAGKATQEAAEATMANISTTVELAGVKRPLTWSSRPLPRSWSLKQVHLQGAGRALPARRDPLHQHLLHVHHRDHRAPARTLSAAWACTSSAPYTL